MSWSQTVLNAAALPQGGSWNSKAERTFTLPYIVVMDDPNDGPDTVRNAPGIPAMFSEYRYGNDFDAGALVTDIRADRKSDSLLFWDVTVTYSSIIQDEGQSNPDPTKRDPEIRLTTVPYQAIVTHDVYGGPLLNTADDEFDPPSKDDSRVSLTITRFESAFQASLAFGYRDCVNTDQFFFGDVGEAKVMRVESMPVVENKQAVWHTTYEIHFRDTLVPGADAGQFYDARTKQKLTRIPPWNINLANSGLQAYSPPKGKGPIYMKNGGAKATTPQRITFGGGVLPESAPRSDAVYLSFEVYRAKPFAALNLP